MNKYMLILADRNEPSLHEQFESCADFLRQTFPKVLLIQPHILIFQSEKDLEDVSGFLPKFAHRGGQAILFQLHDEFRGYGLAIRMAEVSQFFRP
jgi:hypothetical protein